jgi:coenzyme F420 hydrogenase subunit beta
MEGDGKYAFVGLPCHIQGIRRAENINPKLKEKIVFCIALFCSGTPNFLATEYLLRKLKIREKNIQSLNYRGVGWPGNLVIKTMEKGEISIPYPGYWSSFTRYFHLKGCGSCVDWFGGSADVSMGDAGFLIL